MWLVISTCSHEVAVLRSTPRWLRRRIIGNPFVGKVNRSQRPECPTVGRDRAVESVHQPAVLSRRHPPAVHALPFREHIADGSCSHVRSRRDDLVGRPRRSPCVPPWSLRIPGCIRLEPTAPRQGGAFARHVPVSESSRNFSLPSASCPLNICELPRPGGSCGIFQATAARLCNRRVIAVEKWYRLVPFWGFWYRLVPHFRGVWPCVERAISEMYTYENKVLTMKTPAEQRRASRCDWYPGRGSNTRPAD